MSKIGIILCAYGYPQYVDQCLKPWFEAKKKYDILIAAVHGQFFEYMENDVPDVDYKTIRLLEDRKDNGDIDYLYVQNHPALSIRKYEKEHEIRNYAARWLKEQNVDYYFILDLDEEYAIEEIDRIFEYIDRPENQMYVYFNVPFKNIIFDGTEYIKGFCPPRVFRNKYNGLVFNCLYYDNDVVYTDGTNLIKDKQLPNKKIPGIEVKHYTWLHSNGKEKVNYQKKHFSGLCSFRWNEEKDCLEFNDEYFRLTGQQKPIVYKLPNMDYPDETEGTRIAAEIRKKCNGLTREEKDALYKRAIKMIYGEE